jgi:hypothetical protein
MEQGSGFVSEGQGKRGNGRCPYSCQGWAVECVRKPSLLCLFLCSLCVACASWPVIAQAYGRAFNIHYVKTGKIPKELARIYNDLFERRQEGDYIDFVVFQESQVLQWISEAEHLLGYINSLIEKESV